MDFNMKQQIDPVAIASLMQRKYQLDNQNQANAEKRKEDIYMQAAQSAGQAIGGIVEATKAKQKADLVNSLAKSMSSQLATTATPLAQPTQISSMVPQTNSVASFDPNKQQAYEASIKLNPQAWTNAMAEQALPKPSAPSTQFLVTQDAQGNNVYSLGDKRTGAIKQLPGITKPGTTADQRERTVRAAELRAAGMASGNIAIQDTVTATLTDRMKKDMDENSWTGPAAKIVETRNYAKRAKTLFDQVRQQPDGPDARQATEAAMEVTRALIGAGAVSEKLVHDMAIQSGMKQGSKVAEWLTNEPKGNGQVAFMNRLEDTLDRTAVSNQQMIDAEKTQKLQAYRLLKKRDPETWKALAAGAGFDPNNIPTGKGQTPVTPRVQSSGGIDLGNGFSYRVK